MTQPISLNPSASKLGAASETSLQKLISQNTGLGGSMFGLGNIHFPKTAGLTVAATAWHVVYPMFNQQPLVDQPYFPDHIQVDGTIETPISTFFPNVKNLKFLKVLGPQGEELDLARIGVSQDLTKYFALLAKSQPSTETLLHQFKSPNAVWQVTTAARPASYNAHTQTQQQLITQLDGSVSAQKFQFRLIALPLQGKDMAQAMKMSGIQWRQRPETFLAVGSIGGDTANPNSPYRGLYLVNKGVSGSQSVPSGVGAIDSGSVVAGMDMRDADKGWTPQNVRNLVEISQPLREALQVKFPELKTSTDLAKKLFQQGLIGVAYISKETAVSNLEKLKRESTPESVDRGF